MKHLSDNIQGVNNSKQISMTEKERFGLQYLGGYVFHSLYKKLRNSKEWQSQYNTSCMAILRAGKCETDDSQIPVHVKNRGGLRLLTHNGQKLFENVEHLFRQSSFLWLWFRKGANRKAAILKTFNEIVLAFLSVKSKTNILDVNINFTGNLLLGFGRYSGKVLPEPAVFHLF